MDKGTDIHVIHPVTKKNALHFVAASGYVPLATELLRYRVSIHHRDVNGMTPMAIAIANNNHAIKELFEEYLIYLELIYVVRKIDEVHPSDDRHGSSRTLGRAGESSRINI